MLKKSVRKIIFLFLIFALFFAYLAGSIKALGQPAATLKNKARELVLQKKREEGVALLLESLTKGTLSASEKKELQKEVDQLTRVFLTEEAQKNFELAESLFYSSKEGFELKYELALQSEPDNFEILLGSLRMALFKEQCSAAKNFLARAEKLNPHAEEIVVYKLKLLLCSGVELGPDFEWPEAQKLSLPLRSTLMLIRLEYEYKRKQMKEAERIAAQLESFFNKTEPSPEYYYWQFKINEPLPHKALGWAEKYSESCKSLTSTKRRELKHQPRICSKKEEAEKFIAAQENQL